MSGDIGRGFAAVMAIILCIAGPLYVINERTDQSGKYMIQEVLDEFTARTEVNEAVTIGDYEMLLTALAGTGAIFNVELYIGKRIAREADNTEQNSLLRTESDRFDETAEAYGNAGTVSLMQCADHVHTPDCYAGHNHAAEKCVYHLHSQDCYCRGKMTKCYKTDYYDFFCTICDGTGITTDERTCSSCNGEKGSYKTVECGCGGDGIVGVVAPCGKCGGSGVRSSGKECSTCGGTGNVIKRVAHDYCNGTGYITRWYNCASCRGSGIESISETCIFCEGKGQSSGSINYYCCSVCDQGSTTSYGTVCGKKKCTYSREGYACGIDINDNTALCSRIIMDAEYKSVQTLQAGQGLKDIDNNIRFTYMDGSRDIRTATAEASGNIDFSKAGEYEIMLKHTAVYLKAGQNETKYYAVKVIVENDAQPELLGIRAVNRKDEYLAGDTLVADVYALFEGEEQLLEPDDYWDTFDSNKAGPQTVLIGYLGFVTEIDVSVKREDPDESVPAQDEDTHPSPGIGDTGEDRPGEDPGSGNGDPNPDGNDNGSTGGVDPGKEPEGNTGNGNDDPDEGSGNNGRIAEEVIRSGYEEMLGTEEILDMLYMFGRIDLEEGDAFSISVVVQKDSSLPGLGLWGKNKKEKYTSGAVIR